MGKDNNNYDTEYKQAEKNLFKLSSLSKCPRCKGMGDLNSVRMCDMCFGNGTI